MTVPFAWFANTVAIASLDAQRAILAGELDSARHELQKARQEIEVLAYRNEFLEMAHQVNMSALDTVLVVHGAKSADPGR